MENPQQQVSQVTSAGDRRDWRVLVANLETADQLKKELEGFGFAVETTYDDYNRMSKYEKESDSEAIWIGSQIPAVVAVEAIAIARKHWPFLRYVNISADAGVPEHMNSILLLGGYTQTAVQRYRLPPWKEEDFQGLRPSMSLEEFHRYVRERYSESGPDH
jgi:hypothetical protein